VIPDATKFTLPPKVVLGPTVRLAAPKLKLVGTVPDSVKRGNNKLPPVNPDAPTTIGLPAAKVAEADAIGQKEMIPDDVLFNVMESENADVALAASQNSKLPVDEFDMVIFPPKVVLPIYANLTLLAPVFTTVTSLL